MRNQEQINHNIYRLTTPYKDIFTTVYLLQSPRGTVLFDAASYDEDMEETILPWLRQLDAVPSYVFISHNHKDHSGGLGRLLREYPDLKVLSGSPTLKEAYGDRVIVPEDGGLLLETFRVVAIPGHTQDSSSLLDLRTMTLISGDCLQQIGIIGSGDWACNISYPAEYLKTIERLCAMDIKQILTAHDYVPCGYRADGEAEVSAMLDSCVLPLRQIRDLILAYPQETDGDVRARFHADPAMPTVSERVVTILRKAMETGILPNLSE